MTAIESVGPISAVLLFATLGSGGSFQSGREFSAYLGLTPKQYSSIHRVKEPKTPKDKWLLALVSRADYGKASVALANKNVRTAWALLTKSGEYNRNHGNQALLAA